MTLDPNELRALRELEHHFEHDDPELAALLSQGRPNRTRPGLHPPYWPAPTAENIRTWKMALILIVFLLALAMVAYKLSQGG